jgi:basic membrane protein A and related proteins
MRTQLRLLAALVVASLFLTACGGSDSSDDAGDDGLRVAAIFSGPTTDADYNALGLEALEGLKSGGAETSFSESVPVPDIERVLQEYVADGFNVIWTHGSQFYEATAKIASQNPDVNFIGEFDGQPEGQPENVWVIDRNFHTVFYPLGTLAANLTQTGKIAYLGGLSLPFSFAEVHAMQQAIADTGASTKIKPVWTGDFNDASKAQQFSTQLLSQGADVIVGSLNEGASGTFQAFEGKPEGSGWVTAKYTDKSAAAGSHYAGSLEYDFTKPLADVLAKIKSGTRTGRYPLGFDTGVTIDMSDNVPADVKTAVTEVMDKIKSGAIQVKLDVSKVG